MRVRVLDAEEEKKSEQIRILLREGRFEVDDSLHKSRRLPINGRPRARKAATLRMTFSPHLSHAWWAGHCDRQSVGFRS